MITLTKLNKTNSLTPMYKTSVYNLILLFIFFSTQISAQTNKDSLAQKSFTEIKRTFYTIIKTDSIKAKKIAGIYLEKAKKNMDTLKIAKGYNLFSFISHDIEKEKYIDSIISITKNKQNKEYPAYAYFIKAQHFLYQKRNIETTINNLNNARKYAIINKNFDLLYRINYHIGTIKSEHLHEKEKALVIFKECEKYYSKEEQYIHKFRYLYAIHIISETYIGLKKYDSAYYYNILGYNKASKSADPNITPMKAYFSLSEGINQYNKKNYRATIDSIHKSLPAMIEFKDKAKTIDCYFYLGRSHYVLGNKEKAIPYLKKTDSILETLNSIPEYKHVKTYEYLKEYYKAKNDIQNQNKYLNKLNTVLDKYLNDQIFISKKVKEDYDIPLLLDEQKILLTKLNKNKKTYLFGTLILGLLLLISGSLVYYQYRKRKYSQMRFEELIARLESPSERNNIPKDKPINLKVPKKHITHILDKLEEFEKKHEFLNIGISAQSLADTIDTNVKYLSLVINHYKNKTFTSYLNELRINYAVKELQENVVLQKYTIKAIANEFGYNSAETFSNAFYRQIKIKPSYFIKELNKKTHRF